MLRMLKQENIVELRLVLIIYTLILNPGGGIYLHQLCNVLTK